MVLSHQSALERPNKDFQHEGWPCNSISLHYLERCVSDRKARGGITDSLNANFLKASCCSGQNITPLRMKQPLQGQPAKHFLECRSCLSKQVRKVSYTADNAFLSEIIPLVVKALRVKQFQLPCCPHMLALTILG